MRKKYKIIVACAFASIAAIAALASGCSCMGGAMDSSMTDSSGYSSDYSFDESSGGGIGSPNEIPDDLALTTAAVLRQGARGSDVKEVQRRLKQWGYYDGSVDGVFGTGTRSAVIRFQKKNGLTADGVVGKETFKALGMNSAYQALQNSVPSQTGTNGFSESDVYLLARTIYAEGRGEPYTGQVAIGAVIMNRIRSPKFPNTVSGVVYQKHAFTAVSDGQINLTPNDTAMKAARDAINGWDPSGGALYYYNPAVATSSWIFDRQTITVIGRHVFAI